MLNGKLLQCLFKQNKNYDYCIVYETSHYMFKHLESIKEIRYWQDECKTHLSTLTTITFNLCCYKCRSFATMLKRSLIQSEAFVSYMIPYQVPYDCYELET
ncbi:CLUMA_CG008098, isoform A [Clunio marinus]|uniref:CLUMA_CG008098, isoform A n=1 Tax=Clunio marinus TaxID=568069 RepID=A0A1J1I6M7_9DIPT|nr:CLUMA_CG008098, isoform A [Clunio marinus]